METHTLSGYDDATTTSAHRRQDDGRGQTDRTTDCNGAVNTADQALADALALETRLESAEDRLSDAIAALTRAQTLALDRGDKSTIARLRAQITETEHRRRAVRG